MEKRGVVIYWMIFIGMIAGVLIGIVAIECDFVRFIKDWFEPIGSVFVRLLELLAIPLLFVSLIKGVINLKDTTKLVSMGWRTLMLYFGSTLVATILGIILVVLIRPGDILSEETSKEHFGIYASQADVTIKNVSEYAEQSPLEPFVEMIPNNVVKALSGETTMLQALILAVFLGVAIVTIKGERVDTFRNLILDLDAILSRCIDMVMYIAPVGIASLMASVVIDTNGDIAVLGALGLYAVTVLLGLALFAFLFYPLLIKVFTKIGVGRFIKSMIPIQMMAISTSSSAATLPTTMKVANDDLNIPKGVTSFTLPMGVTVNMDGSSVYISVTVIFLAQVMNIDLSIAQLFIILGTGILASVGTPGIPGGVLVTLVMVLNSVGIPAEAIALVIALTRPIDLFVTAVNVTGDVAVSAVVAETLGESESDNNN